MSTQEAFNNPKHQVLFHQTTKKCPIAPRPVQGKSLSFTLRNGVSKKTLVRNTEVSVHPTAYKTDADALGVPCGDKQNISSLDSGAGLIKTDLAAPRLNSALRLVKEMKQASSVKPKRSQGYQLVDEGKVLQQVNFLYEEHLYHDLVELNVSDSDVIGSGTSKPTSKFRIRQKDKEPQLSQFFTPSFTEEILISRDSPQRTSTHLDSRMAFSVYQQIKTWNVS